MKISSSCSSTGTVARGGSQHPQQHPQQQQLPGSEPLVNPNVTDEILAEAPSLMEQEDLDQPEQPVVETEASEVTADPGAIVAVKEETAKSGNSHPSTTGASGKTGLGGANTETAGPGALGNPVHPTSTTQSVATNVEKIPEETTRGNPLQILKNNNTLKNNKVPKRPKSTRANHKKANKINNVLAPVVVEPAVSSESPHAFPPAFLTAADHDVHDELVSKLGNVDHEGLPADTKEDSLEPKGKANSSFPTAVFSFHIHGFSRTKRALTTSKCIPDLILDLAFSDH